MKQLLLPSAKDSSSNVRKWREDLAIALALEEAKVSQELREGTPRNLPLLSVEPGPNPPVAADYPLTVIGRAQYDTAVKARNEQVKDWNASNKGANTKLEKYIRSVAFILSTLSPPFPLSAPDHLRGSPPGHNGLRPSRSLQRHHRLRDDVRVGRITVHEALRPDMRYLEDPQLVRQIRPGGLIVAHRELDEGPLHHHRSHHCRRGRSSKSGFPPAHPVP